MRTYKDLYHKTDLSIFKARIGLYEMLTKLFNKLFMAYRVAGYECRDIRDVILDALTVEYQTHKSLARYDE